MTPFTSQVGMDGRKGGGRERRTEESVRIVFAVVGVDPQSIIRVGQIPFVDGLVPALRFREGVVFKTHRLVYHSTLGLRVVKKKKKTLSTFVIVSFFLRGLQL